MTDDPVTQGSPQVVISHRPYERLSEMNHPDQTWDELITDLLESGPSTENACGVINGP